MKVKFSIREFLFKSRSQVSMHLSHYDHGVILSFLDPFFFEKSEIK